MDASFIFRQGLGSVIPRPPQHSFYPKPRIPVPVPVPIPGPVPHPRDDADGDGNRTAHTLTACCRCRQRKTRCDPTLPRCSPCERSGSTCEYFDTTKGKKINRFYVVKLQETVRQLEATLKQYTDDKDNDTEDAAQPGGLVRLRSTDETPRYLGPSSGIAMTRLLIQEAKRYTDSKRIGDLVPDILKRRRDRQDRMMSMASMAGSVSGPSGGKQNYPMVAEHPAEALPSKGLRERLLEIYNQRAQMFTPVLHEKSLAEDVEAVAAGDTDPYKNFSVNMVMAISLQKLGIQYAGLADSYYLAAARYFQDVIRPKDLKTLQCLVLLSQYSLLTPTRTAVYYITGLATRICQQMGLGDEATIGLGITDPQALDMRRRLAWIVTANEFGLAHTMGRPSGFAKGDDFIDVKFFETVDDECITPKGIKPGPVSDKKLIAIHFCKMRLLQAEIRRVLYEAKRVEPNHEGHPWFSQMEQKCKDWLDSTPEKPEWSKPWFTGRYHSMIITMYRPSPQVLKPTSNAALKCFDSALYIISLSNQQVMKSAIDITWVFLLTIYMSLNALLWSLSYSEVRAQHSKEEVEELVAVAVDIIDVCSSRWPGSASAAELYAALAKACMHSYDVKEESPVTPTNAVEGSALNTPPSTADTSSPGSDSTTPGPSSQQRLQQAPLFNSPFGYVFGATDQEMSTQYSYDTGLSRFDNQPAFRSNSIFHNPGTDQNARRGSYFPPDFTHMNDASASESADMTTPPGTAMSSQNGFTPPASSAMTSTLPTPPESLAPPGDFMRGLSPMPSAGMRTASPTPTPTMPHATPVLMSLQTSPMPSPMVKFETEFPMSHVKQQSALPPPRTAAFTIPAAPHSHPQRAMATTVTDWFSPPPPFISPHSFSGAVNPGYWGEGAAMQSPFAGLGLTGNESYTLGARGGDGGALDQGDPMDSDFDMFGDMSGLPGPYQFSHQQQRHGSLSHEQQMELMEVLETEGMSDIDTFLSAGVGLTGGGVDGSVRWQ